MFLLVSFICVLVGLLAGLLKIYSTVLHKIWMEDRSQPRKDPINGNNQL